MFSPQKLGWPGWSPTSAEKKEKGKVVVSTEARSETVSPVKGLIERAATTTTTASTLEDNGDHEIWRRFREVGAFDEASVGKKDRASFIAHLSSLESELYDYQYNMGVLLMERKDWNTKLEKMKSVYQEAEEKRRLDGMLQLQKLSEAEKRDDGLRTALAIEKQCVADLEKALKDMRAESAELKVSSESKLAQARDIVASTEERALLSDSKLHAADALQAEVRRQLGVAERNLQEVEAREDALRRERLSFKAEQEAHEIELNRQRETLLEWEKKLQEGQDRLLDNQKLLNQREEFANQREEGFKKVEVDLQDTKKQLEKEHALLQQSEADLKSKLLSLSVREDIAVKRDINLDKREQELLLLQEMLASKERLMEQREAHLKESEVLLAKERGRLEAAERAFILKEESLPKQQRDLIELQKAVERQKQELEAMKKDIKLSFEVLESDRLSIDKEREDLKLKQQSLLGKESEYSIDMDILMKLQQQADKRAEEQLEKERDLETNIIMLKDKELALASDERNLEVERKLLAQDKESAKQLLFEIQDLKSSVEYQKQQVVKEEERLRVTEQEREDLVKLQRCLKEEIDDCRARAKTIALEGEDLRREKERFEKEWDLLDEKRDQIKKELKEADEEASSVSKWLRNEEARLKEERKALREQIQNESEALRLEKEDFSRTVELERAEWFAAVEKQREILAKDLDVKKKEMENKYEKRVADIDKQRKDRELRFKKEIKQDKEKIEGLRELAEKKLEAVEQEKHRLDKERQDISKLREDCGKEWMEIKKDIDELQVQRVKLKEQREALIEERNELLQESERLQKLKGEPKGKDESNQVPSLNELAAPSPNWRHLVSPFKQGPAMTEAISTPPSLHGGVVADRVVSDTPTQLSWLRRCVSGLFQSPDGRSEPFIFKGAEKKNSTVSPNLPTKSAVGIPEQDHFSMRELQQGSSGSSKSSDSPKEASPTGKQAGQSKSSGGLNWSNVTQVNLEGAKSTLLPVSDNTELGRGEGLIRVGPTENGDTTGEAREPPLVNNIGMIDIPEKRGSKRHRNSDGNITELDVNYTEAVLNVTTVGGKRKRFSGISERVAENGFGRESPAVRRYNFRRSTMTKVGALQPFDGLLSDQSQSDLLLERESTDTTNRLAEGGLDHFIGISRQEEANEFPTHRVRSFIGSDGLKKIGEDAGDVEGQEGKIVLDINNGGASMTAGNTLEAIGGEDGSESVQDGIEDEAAPVEFSEEVEVDGQLIGESVEESSGGSDSEEDERDEEKSTLKQKWWDYLTT